MKLHQFLFRSDRPFFAGDWAEPGTDWFKLDYTVFSLMLATKNCFEPLKPSAWGPSRASDGFLWQF